MDANEDPQEREWEQLYGELGALLEKHGTQNSVGDGDFWLVDDNYGSAQHKVCVTRLSFLTKPMVVEVQRLLRKYSLDWEVLLSLDGAGMRPTENDLGVLVRKGDIKEYWSAERMKETFGKDFRWEISIVAK